MPQRVLHFLHVVNPRDYVVGADSGSIYRLDLGQVHYGRKSRSELLAEAREKEGRLICVPEELRCKICGAEFSAKAMPIVREDIVDAYEI